jgi:hypothetical protein
MGPNKLSAEIMAEVRHNLGVNMLEELIKLWVEKISATQTLMNVFHIFIAQLIIQLMGQMCLIHVSEQVVNVQSILKFAAKKRIM